MFKIFASMFINDIGFLFSFLCGISVGFGITVMSVSQIGFRVSPCLQFLKNFDQDVC